MMRKAWKIIPRPLLETVLNNHVIRDRVPQPLILHGPRGVGKTTLIANRLLDSWNKPPHFTAYIDFADSHSSSPWASWSNSPPPTFSSLTSQLDTSLEQLVQHGICLGSISSQQIYSTLNKWHGINTALCSIIQNHHHHTTTTTTTISTNKDKASASTSVLWSRAIFAISSRAETDEIDKILGFNDQEGKVVTVEEKSYFREAMLSLRLAKEVIRVHNIWRANAVSELNRTGGYSRSLANSFTDWPCLLLDILSSSAELDYFLPKLVINNIEILRNATTDDSKVSASMYHDSFLWRLIALGINERSLPIILVTSDSYYSYRVTFDFGHPDIFISRETFGWTPQEAKLHMVGNYFSESEWKVIAEVLGSNSRHLSELFALKQSDYFEKIMQDDSGSTFEDIIDAYLAHLQVTVVNPSMERVLHLLNFFAIDVHNEKVSKDCLRIGAPWRRSSLNARSEWAKIQLIDFVQSLVNAEFGLNYFSDYSLEIFEDPCATAMVEVGLLYTQRDPPYIRPISRGIQRCLVRWLVQERMQMNFLQSVQYLWQRVIRGRSYRHLMKEYGYK